MVEAERISNIISDVKIPGRWRNSSDTTTCGGQTTPITMIPGSQRTSFTGRELFYTSARSLSSSHTPPAGSVLAQRMARGYSEPTLEEPLLPEDVTHPSTKSLLCVVSLVHNALFGFHNIKQFHYDLKFDCSLTGLGVLVSWNIQPSQFAK
jgi:hypothetical protein